MQEKTKVLVIDDDQELCSIIDRYLKNAGYETQLVHTGAGGSMFVADCEAAAK